MTTAEHETPNVADPQAEPPRVAGPRSEPPMVAEPDTGPVEGATPVRAEKPPVPVGPLWMRLFAVALGVYGSLTLVGILERIGYFEERQLGTTIVILSLGGALAGGIAALRRPKVAGILLLGVGAVALVVSVAYLVQTWHPDAMQAARAALALVIAGGLARWAYREATVTPQDPAETSRD